MFQIDCELVTGCRNNIKAGTSKEAKLSAEIREGAVQVPVAQKFD